MILNRSYQELAEHYGTAIIPARGRKPRDKSSAEASVRFAETWIVAALRDRKSFSLRELNEAVSEKLEELNNRPFTQIAGCRRSAYLEEEKPYHEDRKLDKAQMLRFATGQYIEESHHIILKGAAGNGKIIYCLCPGQCSLPPLQEGAVHPYARAAGRTKHCPQRWHAAESARIVQEERPADFGRVANRPLSPQESYDMLEFVEARCHKSTIFCTQYESEGWYTRIDPNPESDSPVLEAIMDRIIQQRL